MTTAERIATAQTMRALQRLAEIVMSVAPLHAGEVAALARTFEANARTVDGGLGVDVTECYRVTLSNGVPLMFRSE